MATQRLLAVRGAVTVPADTREDILANTEALLRALLERNGVEPSDVLSIIFTATEDLSAEFPAVAARRCGLAEVPRLCARELSVDSGLSLPRCIRVLMHYHGVPPAQPVYLGDAARLLAPPEEG